MPCCNFLFTAAPKFGPVVGDLLVQIQKSLIHQPVHAGRSYAFCRGINVYQGILFPGTGALGICVAGPKVDDDKITDILGIIDRTLLFETSLAILEDSRETCLEIVDKIYNYGYDIKEFYRALMDQFRNLLVSLIASQDDLLDMSDKDREEIKRQAQMGGFERLQQSLNLLISREEDLRFTFHPRLVLETIMIQLCHLGDDLSFDQLIKKIDALEKRLSTTLSSSDQISMDNLSEPGVDWKTEKRETSEAKSLPDEDDSKDWGSLLKALSSKNRAMANVLKEWHFLNLTDDTLEIAGGSNHFSTGYFDESERMEKFAAFCRDFFKKSIRFLSCSFSSLVSRRATSSVFTFSFKFSIIDNKDIFSAAFLTTSSNSSI